MRTRVGETLYLRRAPHIVFVLAAQASVKNPIDHVKNPAVHGVDH